MQGAQWMDLFRRIPAAQQNLLVLVTNTGMEFMVQKIVRLEDEYAVLRARMSGSNEAGRVLFMPYDQISNLAINQMLKEQDIHAIFGRPVEEIGAPMPIPTAPNEEPAAQDHEEVEEEPSEEPPSPKPAATAPPSKSILLARVRARLKDVDRGMS